MGDATAEGSTNRTELLHTTCGTPNYVAPEVLSNQGYDGRVADVWSIGVILYVLLAGFLPFEERTIAALFSKIKQADYSYPSWFSSDAKDLLDGILVANPAKRFTLQQVKAHSWVVNGPISNPKANTSVTDAIGREIRHRKEMEETASIASEEEVADSDNTSAKNPPSNKTANNPAPTTVVKAAEPAAPVVVTTNPVTNGRPPKTAQSTGPRSLFSCLCSPFSAFNDVEDSSIDR